MLKKTVFHGVVSAAFFIACLLSGIARAAVTDIPLKKGPLADYGASPWYTDNIRIGGTRVKLSIDNGANFTWVTSDQCHSDACAGHIKVNTSDSGFSLIDKIPADRTFGPWGTMSTVTGEDEFTVSDKTFRMPFFASLNYDGDKFKHLAWDGGIGLPSRSQSVTPGSGFFFATLWDQGGMDARVYSVVTDNASGHGHFYMGGENQAQLVTGSRTRLEPARAPGLDYIWGTPLHGASLGGDDLVDLKGILFLDTGSSHFKGDGKYVYPMLERLYELKDVQGMNIFEWVVEDGRRAGLKYVSGGPADYPGLPDFSLRLGTDCKNQEGQEAVLTLTPAQYSYLVEAGDRAGEWVIAFHRLDGIGGLLVGSVLLDLVYSSYEYKYINGNYEQGNMYIYEKQQMGESLTFSCQQDSK